VRGSGGLTIFSAQDLRAAVEDGAVQELLQRQLQRYGAGPRVAGPDDLEGPIRVGGNRGHAAHGWWFEGVVGAGWKLTRLTGREGVSNHTGEEASRQYASGSCQVLWQAISLVRIRLCCEG